MRSCDGRCTMLADGLVCISCRMLNYMDGVQVSVIFRVKERDRDRAASVMHAHVAVHRPCARLSRSHHRRSGGEKCEWSSRSRIRERGPWIWCVVVTEVTVRSRRRWRAEKRRLKRAPAYPTNSCYFYCLKEKVIKDRAIERSSWRQCMAMGVRRACGMAHA